MSVLINITSATVNHDLHEEKAIFSNQVNRQTISKFSRKFAFFDQPVYGDHLNSVSVNGSS